MWTIEFRGSCSIAGEQGRLKSVLMNEIHRLAGCEDMELGVPLPTEQTFGARPELVQTVVLSPVMAIPRVSDYDTGAQDEVVEAARRHEVLGGAFGSRVLRRLPDGLRMETLGNDTTKVAAAVGRGYVEEARDSPPGGSLEQSSRELDVDPLEGVGVEVIETAGAVNHFLDALVERDGVELVERGEVR